MEKNSMVYSNEGFKQIKEIVVKDELFNGKNFVSVKRINNSKKRIFKISLDYCIEIFLTEDCIVPIVSNTEKKNVKVADILKSDYMLFYANKYPDLDFIDISNKDNSIDTSIVPLFLVNKYKYNKKNERTLFLKNVVLEDIDNWIEKYALIKIISIEEVENSQKELYCLEFENRTSLLIVDNILIGYF